MTWGYLLVLVLFYVAGHPLTWALTAALVAGMMVGVNRRARRGSSGEGPA